MNWSATGGEIGADGVFRAGEDDGAYTVTADAGGVKTTVRIRVSGIKERPVVINPTPVVEPHQLIWSGQVPPRKWMNFYSKVLARFVNTGDLTLTVSVKVSPKGGVSPQLVEETKTVLKELGLSPDVRTD